MQLLRQQIRHRGGQVALAQRDGAQGLDDLGGIAFLVQIAACALPDQIDRIVLFWITAQDQDTHVWRLGTQHG
ncbi:hypothetical protein D3C72_1795960 [compost metagenome]